MGYPTSIAVAQTWGICPTCPYIERCRASEFTDRPDDAWCRKKEREYTEENERAKQKAECLYYRVKFKFLEFNAAQTALEQEERKAELLELLESEPGAEAAFDRVAREIDAQLKAQAKA